MRDVERYRGAALFIPIFVIIFPLLGPEYPLATSAAIGSALMTEVFGFSSGFIGYYRKRLIDFKSAVPFISVSIPVAIVARAFVWFSAGTGDHAEGRLCTFDDDPLPGHSPPHAASGRAGGLRRQRRRKFRRRNAESYGTGRHQYRFNKPRQGIIGGFFTSIGAFLTGFLGVGVGEVILPQLVKRNNVPVAVAAATSVLTVIVTIASASFTQIAALIEAGGLSAVPWNLVCYTIPAVIIGGQIGPLLQGRIEQQKLEKAIAIVFGIIGVSMAWIVLKTVL